MGKENPLEVLSDPDPANFNAVLVNPNKTVKRVIGERKGPSETSLQLLKRLFGETVFEIFPQEIIEAVDTAYAFWEQNPDSYLVTEFPDAKSRDDALGLMRAYAEIGGPAGYTIRTLKDAADYELHWRAQTRIKHGSGS